ncbi:MAG: hypothetical protein R2774_02175 [Saprospiraceae bacterium]
MLILLLWNIFMQIVFYIVKFEYKPSYNYVIIDDGFSSENVGMKGSLARPYALCSLT